MFPDFSQLAELGKQLTDFMHDVNYKLDNITERIRDNDEKIEVLINLLKGN